MAKILIIEDNSGMREMLSTIIGDRGHKTKTAEDTSTASLILKKESFDLIISDFQLPDMDGLTFFKRIKHLNIPVIILTAFGTIETAVEAIKEGAFDFVSKPVDPSYLFIVIDKALESTRIMRENIVLKEAFANRMNQNTIIGQSRAIMEEAEKLKRVAATNTPALLLGESGTGKELFARAIHNLSSRKDAPFIAINAASIPEQLLENELFGHEKGSYTDAYQQRIGKLELAQKGTFFMDEIGDLPFNLQGKLLRVLEEKKVTRIGSNQETELDIRFIFATNKDLSDAVANSEFRADLFYRINIFPIELPPLRNRKEDVPLLAEFFLKKFAKDINSRIQGISPEAGSKLAAYSWPGNIRELQNTIERAVINSSSEILKPEDIMLPKPVFNPSSSFSLQGTLKEVTHNAAKLVEKMKIEEVLEETGFNKSKAAEILQVNYKTLLEKIKEHHLNR